MAKANIALDAYFKNLLYELIFYKSNRISVLVFPEFPFAHTSGRSPDPSTFINVDSIALMDICLGYTISPSHGHCRRILANCA